MTLLHSGSESDRSLFWNFVEAARERKICIAKSLVIKPEMPVSEVSALFTDELDPNSDSKVIVLLLDDPQSMENVLEAAKKTILVEDFVWVGMESERDGKSIAKILQGMYRFVSLITVLINRIGTLSLCRLHVANIACNCSPYYLKTYYI